MERISVDRALQSLAVIANRYDISLQHVVAAVTRAWHQQTAHCGRLHIRRRSRNADTITVLITREAAVIAQCAIHVSILRNPNYYIARARVLYR